MTTLSPRSMPTLVFTGLLIVTLPLASAVVIGIVHVDQLVQQSNHLVNQGIKLTRHSRLLQEQVNDMERSARQFSILGDPTLIDIYIKHQTTFRENLKLLETLELKGVSEWNFEQIKADSDWVLATLKVEPHDSPKLELAFENFTRMSDLADGLEAEGNAFIDNELEKLNTTAAKAQRFLFWAVIGVLPGVAVLIIMFTYILSRPLRLITGAIKNLGEGQLKTSIEIHGPPIELEALGNQLEWLRTQLEIANEESDTFLRHMSHELKTPLSSIKESTELLIDGTLGGLSENQNEVVRLLKENANKLEFLIENLLHLNTGNNRDIAFKPEFINVTRLLRELIAEYKLIIDSKHLKVTITAPQIHIFGDLLKTRMAFNNLISNAIKYSPQKGEISIQCRSTRKLMTVDIQDEGPGIPESERKLVFQPFYQGRQESDSHVRGTGIGLSVVRDCINAHAGNVEILNSDKGTHIRVEMPINRNFKGGYRAKS